MTDCISVFVSTESDRDSDSNRHSLVIPMTDSDRSADSGSVSNFVSLTDCDSVESTHMSSLFRLTVSLPRPVTCLTGLTELFFRAHHRCAILALGNVLFLASGSVLFLAPSVTSSLVDLMTTD